MYYSLLRFFAALRIVFFPSTIVQFFSMNILAKLNHSARKRDSLYFLVHRYYMSRHFALRQRVQIAMNHHKYEFQTYDHAYLRQVYRLDGILLWERRFERLHFTILLVSAPDNRHEGDLSVVLCVNKIKLCTISFCYLNASFFGLSSYTTMLISRNQTDRTSSRDAFDRCFGQNSPQLFCLSAVCGIAMANGFKTVFAVKHDAQIAYEELLDASFRNSYSALWEKFGAIEIDRHVYMLDVPLKLRPVGMVNPAHRRRARARRGYWDEIVQSTRSTIVKYRKLSCADQTFEAAAQRSAHGDGQLSSKPTLWASATPTSGSDKMCSPM
jgi:uncharacterized protein VirK/YbjX